ncbi:hypothetical protein ASPACDRAFT_75436 [Aspergillus aculeatus ATCC 16872]|uniref:Thymocyte nuclear protein 1 n=1 Tax=Aspergillus aculeatus (strain ATCC 16872 / CBS 172.66 / WB 5094) TaxID=690307 RepID=A0A1L9X619_ASPA1|nr:uncharacterized protein ASPACDRAFT_75436 [Aspergillus aculeatus ATCC 16872]OJK03916.1 hypothetical protein ASPACDRAFT_75436 [Aspergillus aculeatus ATCC 16872]
MPPQRKRKSEGASIAEESAPAAKRVAPDTPADSEKRKRGRPRKYPEGSTPKRPDGPKRGRGRPRKDPNSVSTPSKPKTPKSDGTFGRGRPRKSSPKPTPTPSRNGTTRSTPKQTKTESPEVKSAASAKSTSSAKLPTPVKATSGPSYWLMKAEPESRMEKGVDVKFSIDDLRERTEPEAWDGVRNPSAQRHMRAMKKGDQAFFYHSNCKVPGVAGVMEIVEEHFVDESAFDPAHPYYDAKSKREKPKWEAVRVEFRRKFKNLVPLSQLKENMAPGKPLANLEMLKQSRLSVSSVRPDEWEFILGLAEEEGAEDKEVEATETAEATEVNDANEATEVTESTESTESPKDTSTEKPEEAPQPSE